MTIENNVSLFLNIQCPLADIAVLYYITSLVTPNQGHWTLQGPVMTYILYCRRDQSNQ